MTRGRQTSLEYYIPRMPDATVEGSKHCATASKMQSGGDHDNKNLS